MSQPYPVPIPLPQPKSRPPPDSRGIPDTLNVDLFFISISVPQFTQFTSNEKSSESSCMSKAMIFCKANILLKFFYMVATRKLAVMGPLTW